MKCEKIINRIESSYLAARKEADSYLEGVSKIHTLCSGQRGLQLSREQMFKDIEKTITRLTENYKSEKEEAQHRTKKLLEESRLLNNKLEKQTKELSMMFEDEKVKMKAHYE